MGTFHSLARCVVLLFAAVHFLFCDTRTPFSEKILIVSIVVWNHSDQKSKLKKLLQGKHALPSLQDREKLMQTFEQSRGNKIPGMLSAITRWLEREERAQRREEHLQRCVVIESMVLGFAARGRGHRAVLLCNTLFLQRHRTHMHM